MSVPNREFFHHYTYEGYSPVWYHGYDPLWLLGAPVPPRAAGTPDPGATDEELTELRVPLCCEGCAEKVHKKLKVLEGVWSVHCDAATHKVTVRGSSAKPERILEEVKKIKNLQRSELWKAPGKSKSSSKRDLEPMDDNEDE